MRILLTNDDGIEAAGLEALLAVATQFGEVTVVAPHTHQSAQSHAITLTQPLVAHKFCFDAFPAVRAIGLEGHPADCVRLSMRNLLDAPPDLVLSGINAGANVGMNIHYSGTVGAAAEAAMYNVPAVAFSVATPFDKEFQPDMNVAIEPFTTLLATLLDAGIAPGELININLPNQQRHPA
ncbi:MAG: 5'/3'-nucleotidase SurE, partial [Phycisphaerales bacterium]|nr:5'/3'-nucleotidase SurE [Phycisphaerales bacterium]